MKLTKTVLVASTVLAASASFAWAAPAVGLVGEKTLVMFDTQKPVVSKTLEVEGVQRLVGIDLRPSNGTLVGVTPDGVIVTIDLKTGRAAELARMDKPLAIGDAPIVVDFNPAADRLRFMTGTTNHRVHPDTGAVTVDGSLAFEEGDMHKGETPAIVAAAYTNSHGKPEKTAMFNIDATIGGLIQQTKPNDGTLKAIGKLGLAAKPATYAFDIQTTADGSNTAWLVADNVVHTVDLETGKATRMADITGTSGAVRDIAVLPAM
ncbi:DUF4394 domain-containing protein [Neorhizobium galegae]|uniref:DUF4394 domain-containing protein n=1 Tax=Neorhizobium galegae TaxID=399 RepID=UPI001AE6F6B9|nr:DUF4394 domain-containing protein [Neorhizobium galegae]